MPSPTLSKKNLQKITVETIGHYDDSADSFWTGTKDHDVSQNIQSLLRYIIAKPPYRILDFGCGPGRDLLTFTEFGHRPTGLDGSANFVSMAKRLSGCPVLHQDFLNLDLPNNAFDGVFANATLFHVPQQELPRVLRQLWEALDINGVLFSSNPRGDNQEGWSGQRYGCYLNWDRWKNTLENNGLLPFAPQDMTLEVALKPMSTLPTCSSSQFLVISKVSEKLCS